MLKINGKTFMNLQEAVQWLLDNNALPFQSSANYVANTEIGMGTIVNPSPAKVRIGSLIFFADSKVSTVIGITENGFICSDQYNNLVDDVAYVTNVAINASGHLITTMSDGQTIDAGLIKQVSSFSIDNSQHLIVNYNDGTSTDLGAIFSGNLIVSGYVEQQTANYSSSISFSLSADALSKGMAWTAGYSKYIVINGVLHVIFHGSITNTSAEDKTLYFVGNGLNILPAGVASKIYDLDGNNLHEHVDTAVNITAGLLTVAQSKYDINNPMSTIPFALQHANVLTDRISILLSTGSGISIPAGATRYISGRLALTLLD